MDQYLGHFFIDRILPFEFLVIYLEFYRTIFDTKFNFKY